MNNSYLEDLIDRATLVPDQFQNAYGELTPKQFNWKPSSINWSIGECLSHLVTTNKCYLPIINKVVEGNHKNSLMSKIPGLPGMWGKILLKMVSPEIKKKVKTLKAFQPDSSSIEISLLEEFCQLQQQLIELMKQSDVVDHEKIIITSPASRLITYSLKDTCNILIDHELRHFKQASAVMKEPAFPSSE